MSLKEDGLQKEQKSNRESFFFQYNTLNIYLRDTQKKGTKKKSQKKPPKSVALFLSVFGVVGVVGFAFRRESNNGDTKEEKEEEGRRRLFPTTTTTLRERASLREREREKERIIAKIGR